MPHLSDSPHLFASSQWTFLTPALYSKAQDLQFMCFQERWNFETLFAYPNTWGYICQDDLTKHCIGLICMRQVCEEAEVLTLCVDPEYRQQGIGTVLLMRAKNDCSARDVKRILLEVDVHNESAYRLYTRLNFRQVGTRPNYYHYADGRVHDAMILMHLMND